MNSTEEFLISIVIPVHNEEDNISHLYFRLRAVIEKGLQYRGKRIGSFEIILVDDGSSDRTWPAIAELHAGDARVKGISFSRNFGHHIAISAGLDFAQGDLVVLMDGDLQDPPEEIPKLLEQLDQGFDLAYGIRREKRDSLPKRVTSYLFWWLINALSDTKMPKNQTLLRIFNKRVLNVMKTMRERARFVHGMIAWAGFRSTSVEIEHMPRERGRSKYDVIRLFTLAFNAITSFSTLPLRLATYMGLISAGSGLLVGLFFIYKKLFWGIPVLGYASIVVAVLFMGGIQLLILGIMGEYLGRVYQEVQGRPIYIVREQLLD